MKKLLALGLAICLILAVLAGCTNSGSSNDQTIDASTKASESTNENTDSADTDAPDTAAEPQGTDHSAAFTEHADLKMLVIGPMPMSDDAITRLSAAISKITEEKFNASVELVSTTFQDYANKMNMMLATGDQIDIFQPLMNLTNFAAQGYLLDLNPYSDLYQNAAELLGPYLKGGMLNGAQYCIPNTAQGTTGGDSWIFDKTLVEELDLQPMLDEAKHLADLEPVFQKIRENTDRYPLIGTTEDPVIRSMGDAISGKTYISMNAFCYVDPDEPDVVKAIAERPSYKESAELAWKWANMDLTSYDELGTGSELFKAGRTAAFYMASSPVVQYEAVTSAGTDNIVVWTAETAKPWVTVMTPWSYCVSSYCEAPEQAIAVINEFFINPDLANILEWGEEGVDYVIADPEKGLVTFPEGVHPGNVGYYNYVKDSVANQFICYESVDSEGYHKLQQDYQKNGVNPSPYIGFAFDAEKVSNEFSACTNVQTKYNAALMNGLLNPADQYDKYVQELYDNGLQNIIDETQRQLDQWISENK